MCIIISHVTNSAKNDVREVINDSGFNFFLGNYPCHLKCMWFRMSGNFVVYLKRFRHDKRVQKESDTFWAMDIGYEENTIELRLSISNNLMATISNNQSQWAHQWSFCDCDHRFLTICIYYDILDDIWCGCKVGYEDSELFSITHFLFVESKGGIALFSIESIMHQTIVTVLKHVYINTITTPQILTQHWSK